MTQSEQNLEKHHSYRMRVERGRKMVTVVTNEDDFCDKATQLLAVFARDNKDNLARIHTKAVETFGIIGLSFYLEEYYHLLCSWGIQGSVTMKVIKASIEDISV